MSTSDSDKLPYLCVFVFADGHVLCDGSSMADVVVNGVVCEGRPFAQVGHFGSIMLFIEATDQATEKVESKAASSLHLELLRLQVALNTFDERNTGRVIKTDVPYIIELLEAVRALVAAYDKLQEQP